MTSATRLLRLLPLLPLLLLVVCLAACEPPPPPPPPPAPPPPPPTREEPPPPAKTPHERLIERLELASYQPAFEKALRVTIEGTGGKPRDIWPGLPGFYAVASKPDASIRTVLALRETLRNHGAAIYRYERGFGSDDVLALVPSADPWDAIRAIGTAGPGAVVDGHGVDAQYLVGWLKALHETAPFALVGVGREYIELRFDGKVGDPDTLAERAAAICPDLDLAQLTAEIRGGKLTLWWDAGD